MNIKLILGVLLLLISSRAMTGVAMVQSVPMIKDNKKCEVFFFEKWSGYSHPVKVIGPLNFTEALLRGNYQRAWICEIESKSLFTLLEGISVEGLKGLSIKFDSKLTFFSARDASDGASLKGVEVSLQDTFVMDKFFVDIKEANGNSISKLITQKKYSQFEYCYNVDGKMTKLRVTDMFGDIKELNY